MVVMPGSTGLALGGSAGGGASAGGVSSGGRGAGSLAEGCGLPVLEALWMGVPCVCSDLAVLRENADGGGCVPVALNDRAAWVAALRRVLTDDAAHAKLVKEATTRTLPTWKQAAGTISAALH